MKDILNIELIDDNTDLGGTSCAGETLQDFLDEIGLPYDTPLKDINKALSECGIRTIPELFDGWGERITNLMQALERIEELEQMWAFECECNKELCALQKENEMLKKQLEELKGD